MTKERALEYVAENYPFDWELYDEGYTAIVRIRASAVILPEIGVDGSVRDENTWAYLDMTGKIDTGMYGDVYYFRDMKKATVWLKE